MTAPTARRRVTEWDHGTSRVREDRLITEEPLEIRVESPGTPARRFGVTMRTPGHDFELAAGLALAEGVVTGADDLLQVAYCTDGSLAPAQRYDVVTLSLAGPPPRAWVDRTVSATSACGVCGTDSLDEVAALVDAIPPAPGGSVWTAEALSVLPDALRAEQRHFDRTGGSHAAGLFAPEAGRPLVVREDVGRHNAVDKVVGHQLLARLPMAGTALCTSGRIGFEIVQKAAMAGVAAVVGVGAPTTLAAELSDRVGLVLAGFARGGRVVVYSRAGATT